MYFSFLLVFIFFSVIYNMIIINTKYIYLYAINLTLMIVLIINYLNCLDRCLIIGWLKKYKIKSIENINHVY